MAYKIENLVKQYEEVIKKYSSFRDNPSKKSEEDFESSLDVLESMIPIYETGSGKKLNPTKQEEALIEYLKNRNIIENVLESNYDLNHGLTDKFIDLEDALKILKIENDDLRNQIIQKALKGKLYNLDDVIKDLEVDVNEK